MPAEQTGLPESYYVATMNRQPDVPRLEGESRADVCVIGGGYTGLSSAIHLAERGYSVVLLEAQRVGWGASGRNGGQCSVGQRKSPDELQATYGKELAHRLWDLGVEAVAVVRELIEQFGIDCDLKRGCLQAALKRSDAEWFRRHADFMHTEYGFEMHYVEGAELEYYSGTDVFCGGLVEYASAHLHPLNYALGLAEAARGLGVQMATLAGKLIAEAVAGTAERFDVMAGIPSPSFPGGTLLRWPGLVAGMLYHALKDRIGD